SRGEDKALGCVACPHLVQIGLLPLDLAAEVPGVAREKPRPVASQLLSCRALDLAVGEATRSQQLRKRQSLNELRIEIELGRVAQPCAEEKRPGKRVTPCPVGVQAMGTAVRRGEGRLVLPDVGSLSMDVLRGLGRVGSEGRARAENRYAGQASLSSGRMLQVAYTSRPPGFTSRAAAARMRCCFWASSATASGPCRHLRSGLRRRVPKPLHGASTSTRSSLPARRLARVSISPE